MRVERTGLFMITGLAAIIVFAGALLAQQDKEADGRDVTKKPGVTLETPPQPGDYPTAPETPDIDAEGPEVKLPPPLPPEMPETPPQAQSPLQEPLPLPDKLPEQPPKQAVELPEQPLPSPPPSEELSLPQPEEVPTPPTVPSVPELPETPEAPEEGQAVEAEKTE